MKEIYFPMSARVITPGHIKCLEVLTDMGFVTIGLLTKKAMKGYKKEVVPFSDRKYVLETIARGIGDIYIVPQNSLDPTENIKICRCTAIASGDGFNEAEQKAIKKLGLEVINIRFKKEVGKKYSSSKLLNE